MLQKAKSTLLKVLICVCLVCCLVAMFVAVTACNKTEAPTVVGGHVDTNGHLILEMSDGSTSDAGLVAQPGTPGTNGTNGANGVGIKNVTINNDGDLVITLDNDKEIVVKIPDYSVNCVDGKEHVWTDLHKVVDANCISGETWLTVCRRPGCNAMYLSQKGDPNPDNHLNLQPYGDPATCTKAGRDDQQCQDCGEIVEGKAVPAKGHTPYRDAEGKAWRGDVASKPADVVENWVPVVDDVSIFCLEGGEEALVCADCHEEVLDTKDSPAPGHLLVGEWTITQRPTDDETGLAEGLCARCGKTSIVLPKLTAVSEGVAVWNREQENEGMCTEGSVKAVETTYTYTYHYTDDTKDPAEAKTHDFTFTVEEDVKHQFTIDGVKQYFQTGEISGTSPVYNDSTKFHHFANSPNDCTVVGFASFECEVCHGTILIRVRGTNHDLDKTTVVSEQAPTCTQPGYKEYKCKRGLGDPTKEHTYKETVAALGHDWEVVAGESDFSKAESEQKATIVLHCKRCNTKQTIEAENLQTDTTAATCEKAGKTVYTYDYTPEGGEKVTGATTEITLPQLFHTVTKDGKSYSFTKNHTVEVEGWTERDEIVYELEDIAKALGYESISALLSDGSVTVKAYANANPSCTEPGLVSFKCSAGCGGDILVPVRGEHDWQPDPEHDVKASCAGEGNKAAKAYVCKNDPKHTKLVEEGEIPAHQWKAELGANNKITFTCQVCNKVETGELDTTQGDNGILKEEPTCAKAGKYTYYYKDPSGKPGTIEVVKPQLTTHTFGKLTDIVFDAVTLQKYTVGQFAAEGAIEDNYGFANSHPTCLQKGYITITCSVCKQDLVIYVQGDHQLGEEKQQLPTCVVDGFTYQECSVCHKKVEKDGSTVKATGHKLNVVVETEPTAEKPGSAKVTCSNCSKVNETIELPALSDSAWKKTGKDSTCTVPGSDTYVYTFEFADKEVEGKKVTGTVEVVVERDLLEHDLEEKLLDWYSEDTLTHYWGHLCKKCNQLIVDHKEKLEAAGTLEEGEFLLSVFQAARNDGKGERLYFTGAMKGFYYETTTDVTKAAKVTVSKSGDDGYVLKVGDKFIEIEYVAEGSDGKPHTNVVLKDAQTEGVVWKWNATAKTFTLSTNNTEYYIGSDSKYDTLAPHTIDEITGENAGNVGKSEFVSQLVTLVADAAE